MPEQLKHYIDLAAVSTWLTALLGFIPHFAAVVSVIWGLMRIYESYLNIQLKKKALNK